MERLIRPKELAEKLGGIALSTLYERMKEPDFPRKVRLGPNSVAFRISEVEAWIESKTEERETTGGIK